MTTNPTGQADGQQTPGPVDPDDLELQAAIQAAQQEEGQGAGSGADAGQQDQLQDGQIQGQDQGQGNEGQKQQAQQPGQQDQGGQQQAGQEEPPPVPYSRFAQVNRAARDFRDQAIYYQGVVEALQAGQSQGANGGDAGGQQGAGQGVQQQQQDIPTQIQAEQGRVIEAAEKYDRGEITLTDLKKIEFEADNVITSLRQQAYLEEIERHQPQPAQAGMSLADETILENQLAELNGRHGYLGVLSDQDLATLKDMAYAEAARSGRPIGTGPRETMRLRQSIAELSDLYGPRWYPQARVQSSPTGGGQQRPAPGAMSGPAQARLNKMGMAAALPPNTNAMGGPGASDAITEAQIETMSDEEIAALPPTVRQRILGG